MDNTQVQTTETPVNETPTASEAISSALNEQTTDVTPEVSSTQVVNEPTQQTTPEQPTTFDPKLIESDPNLQLAYKQMQADYTRKMQEIAQKEAQYQRYEKVLPVLDQLTQGQTQQAQEAKAILAIEKQLKEAGYADEAIEQGKVVAKAILDDIREQQAQIQAQAQAERQMSQINSSIEEAVKLDPRLNDQSLKYDMGNGEVATYGQVVEELVAADPNWQANPLQSIQRAIKKVDAMLNTAKLAGKQELSTQAVEKGKTFAPVNSSSQGSVDTNESVSLRDSIEKTLKELSV